MKLVTVVPSEKIYIFGVWDGRKTYFLWYIPVVFILFFNFIFVLTMSYVISDQKKLVSKINAKHNMTSKKFL